MIRTVLGDIAPDTLGLCLMHEHLLGAPPASIATPDHDLVLDQPDAVLVDLRRWHDLGGRAVVEMTPIDYQRQPVGLADLATRSGIAIVAVTGFLKEQYCGAIVSQYTDQQLQARFIKEITVGMDDTPYRAGVIKAGSSLNTMTQQERRVFVAAAAAHHATGALISTHTEAGTMGLEQAQLLIQHGVRPARILIGHGDRNPDDDALFRLLDCGVNIGFDHIGKTKYSTLEAHAKRIATFVARGYAPQLALSSDLARRSAFHGYTPHAAGLGAIMREFRQLLVDHGVHHDHFAQMTITNPRQLLALSV